MRRRFIFDIHAFIQSLILAGFLTLLIWLINTQQLSLYINPRFNFLTELSGWVLFLMLVVQTASIIHPARIQDESCDHSHSGQWVYIPFIIVLLLAFWVPSNTLNASLVNTKGLNSQPTPASNLLKDMPRPLADELRQKQSIEVTDRTFTEIMSEINLFPQDYLGKKVTMTGFVFKHPGAAANQFSLVRYVITCCAADSRPYGVLCETDQASKYPEGTWLLVTGIVQMGKADDQSAPALSLTSIKKIEEPKEPYVFPYEQ